MMKKLFLLFFICLVVVGGAFVHDVFLMAPKPDAKPVEVVIAQGDSVSTIGTHLEKAQLVAHPLFFKWFVRLTQTQTKLQAGTFSLTPGTSIAALVLLLSDVQSSEVQVTIPEGFTKDQIKTKLVAAFPTFDVAEWEAQTKNLEGYLFPDTYRFAKDASVKEIVEKMRITLDRRLLENDIAEISVDTLIMASIIEKEVQTPEDMKRVAGILFNRIRIGMPLQVDSTLTYINQKTSATLTTADLKMNSPYNTYTHKGLPPGPICNPGIHAILAVLHPTPSQDFYFLTTKNNTVMYAQTHDQHVANKQKYLR